jgi:hypothetical protein
MLVVTGIILASVFYPEHTKASILAGIDEPTGNVYDDLYVAEENATSISGSYQTTDENNTGAQK